MHLETQNSNQQIHLLCLSFLLLHARIICAFYPKVDHAVWASTVQSRPMCVLTCYLCGLEGISSPFWILVFWRRDGYPCQEERLWGWSRKWSTNSILSWYLATLFLCNGYPPTLVWLLMPRSYAFQRASTISPYFLRLIILRDLPLTGRCLQHLDRGFRRARSKMKREYSLSGC